MDPLKLIIAFLLVLLLQMTDNSAASQVLKANLSCLDCKPDYDFSGNKVLVKCDKVKNLAIATTEEDGSFEVELPSQKSNSHALPSNCIAKLIGGPNQLFAYKKDIASMIVKAHISNSYTISSPLIFSTTCPSTKKGLKCDAINQLPSSKTVNLPLPPEWGFAPSSYYVPFFPIIGIP